MISTRRYYWSKGLSERMAQIIAYIREHVGSASYMAFEIEEASLEKMAKEVSASIEISGARFDLTFSDEFIFICSHFDRAGQYLLIDFYSDRLNFTSPDYVFTLKALTAVLSLPEAWGAEGK